MAASSLALAGLAPSNELDGVNIVPYLTNEKKGEPHEQLYWRFWDQVAIRIGDMKFLKAGKREFLFGVFGDVHESKNTIEDNPKLTKKMKKAFIKWSDELHNPDLSDEIKREKRWYDHYFIK